MYSNCSIGVDAGCKDGSNDGLDERMQVAGDERKKAQLARGGVARTMN